MPRTAKGRKKTPPPFFVSPDKKCLFDLNNIEYIDFKDVEVLSKFVSWSGKILSRKITGTTAKNQRKLALAIKRAREIGLMDYIKR